MNKKLDLLMKPIENKESKPTGEDKKVGMDFSYFQENKVVLPIHGSNETIEPEEIKKKTTRKRSTSSINKANKDGLDDSIAYNEPYSKKYEETTNLLKTAIVQLDNNLMDMQTDIQQVRSSRTLKRKFDYLSMIQGNMGQFINTKVTALREINNTITKCNELELRRIKDLRLAENEKNDDKTIMDMYNAFISTPTSTGYQLGPSLQDITTSAPNIMPANMSGPDAGYQNYLNNLTPSQVLMMYEDDPDVQQVVMYDESTGARWFEIMNLRTNEVIKGADKHDQMFMEDTDLDLNNGIARNINLGESFPIIRVGKSIVNTY